MSKVAAAEVDGAGADPAARTLGPSSESAVVVLPHPDSPTSPSASPRANANVALLTTLFQRSFDQKSIVRPSTRTRASCGRHVRTAVTGSALHGAPERAGHAVGDEVEADHQKASAADGASTVTGAVTRAPGSR